MKILAKQNRELIMINAQNTQNENDAEKITLQVPEQYEDFNKKIVFVTPAGNVWDIITNNEYLIKKAITKYKQVDFYIWLTKGDVDFRSQTKTLKFYHNVDASDEITNEEIGRVNTVVNLLEEEITKVENLESQIDGKLEEVDTAIDNIHTAIQETENLDLDAEKVGQTTTVTLTKKDGTVKTIHIDDGVDLQFMWQGTSLGIKTAEQQEYTFVNLQGATGPVGPTGNGISSITKTGTDGLVDTYTITYTNGNTTTFTVTNGEDANITRTEFEELKQEIENIQNTRGHVYGIRRKISNNTSSSWERLDDAVGLVANATKNGGTVQNDFDSLAPWSDIKSCNYDLTTKKINAWFGDANFKFDGTNGDVFTHIPKTYWKIYQENDYDYVLLADYPRAGFMEVDGFFIGRYNASVVSDVLHSYSGLVPTTNKTIGQFRTLANALGSNFSQLDWRYFVLQMLYLVEYANYNSQSMLGNGIQSRKYLKTLVAESNTNRAIVGSSSGYYVGQIIRIGTADTGAQIADARKITAIEAYDEDGVTGAALTFDGAAVNIAIDNFVCTMAQETGQCDSLGMKSGCLNNDGYHSMIYRGVENIFANIWQWVDGINIKDNLAYICKDHSQYADNVFADAYKALAYTNASNAGWAKTLGLDVDEPFIRFPTETGGGSSNYMADYYYQNTGNRVARVGGNFYSGASDGLWSWNLDSASSVASWNVGARVLIDNQ